MIQFRNAKIRIIPPFSQEEIASMANAASSEGSSIAARDYAVLLLGFDTGLRGVDIQKLKLSDIDWKKATVTVRQSKTGQPVVLPLRGIVMNAIADYILKERPKCGYDEIFITSKAPYRPIISKGGFNRIIRKYGRSSGIEQKPKRGFHSLRRSFATEMSLAGVALPTISQMLGHKDVGEDRPYLSYNRGQVSFCAMGFSDVPLRNSIYRDLLEGSLKGRGDPV
jgi:integrase